MNELKHWLELEHIKFRASLVQNRIAVGLTKEDLVVASGGAAEWVDMMEDLHSDPRLSDIRHYATLIGVAVEHRVIQLPRDEQSEGEAS